MTFGADPREFDPVCPREPSGVEEGIFSRSLYSHLFWRKGGDVQRSRISSFTNECEEVKHKTLELLGNYHKNRPEGAV